jgi:hypothetical protein
VLVVGDVIRVREALSAAVAGHDDAADEVKYGRQ